MAWQHAPKINTLVPKRLVGMRRRMTFADGTMASLWQAFRPRVGDISGRTSTDFVSMRIYDQPLASGPTPHLAFEQWAAVEVGEHVEAPEELETYTISGGLYATFRYRGRADAFAGTARWFYGVWLPSSGFELDEREHFEVLPADYRPDHPEAEEDIWIPIRRA